MQPDPFPFMWSHNHAAVVGIIICVVMLLVWFERDAITLRRGKRDWDK